MTGYRSSHLCHDCRTDGCYIDQLPDWDDLLPCFPRKIRPTDVDGMVEVSGNVLFLEEKSAGASMKPGQAPALRSLCSRPGITALAFRPVGGPLAGVDDLECLVYGQGPPQGWQSRSRTWLRDWLRKWSAEADRNPYVSEAGAA